MRVDLRAVMVGGSAVAAIVAARVYWGDRPQGSVLPAVLLTKVSTQQEYHLSGITNLAHDRVQVDCYAGSMAEADALRNAVVALLSNYSGTQGATRFQGIYLDGERDLSEPGASTGAGRIFRVSLDFMVHHGVTP